MCEALFIGFGVVLVTGRHVGATDHDFASGTSWQQAALGVHDANLGTSGNAYHARFAHTRGQRVAGHLVRSLGHAVGFY